MSSRKWEERKNRLSTPRPSAPKVELTGGRSGAEHAATLAPDLPASGDVLRLQRVIGNRAVGRMLAQAGQRVIQRVTIAGVDVDKQGRMPSWEQDGVTYHLNVTTDPYHVTQEGRSAGKKKGATKTHYFFTRDGEKCVNAIGKGGVPGSKKKFSDLPKSVQGFVQDNFMELISD